MSSSTANTLAIVSAVVGPFILMLISFLTWIVKKLITHDVSLAVLIQQVNPPGDKSLRDLLTELKVEQVKIAASSTLVANSVIQSQRAK